MLLQWFSWLNAEWSVYLWIELICLLSCFKLKIIKLISKMEFHVYKQARYCLHAKYWNIIHKWGQECQEPTWKTFWVLSAFNQMQTNKSGRKWQTIIIIIKVRGAYSQKSIKVIEFLLFLYCLVEDSIWNFLCIASTFFSYICPTCLSIVSIHILNEWKSPNPP